MSVIASNSLDNDEDLQMSNRIWEELREKGFDGIGEKSEGEESSSEESDDESDAEEAEGEVSDAESVDSKVARVNEMADEFETTIARQREYAMNVDRNFAAKEMKKKSMIDQQRLRRADESEEDALDNKDVMLDGDKHADA